MDDVFGEILYIIIMLAIFIFSAFRKKKVAGGNMPEEKEFNPMEEIFTPFEDLIEEPEEEPKPPKEEATLSSAPNTIENYPFVKEDYVFTSNTSPEDIRRQRKNKKSKRQTVLRSEEENLKFDELSDEHLLKNFDLRKAVIYSEILKRPEY